LHASLGDEEGEFQINKITSNVYEYRSCQRENNYYPESANGAFIVTDSGVVMIETPWDTTIIEALLDTIKSRYHQKVIMSIITSSDINCTKGIEVFRRKGIKTWASARTKYYCSLKGLFRPDFTFINDTVFTIGTYQLKTYYPGKGKSEDNIVIWIPGDSILWGGSLVISCDKCGLDKHYSPREMLQWKRSFRKVKHRYKDARFIICGTGRWDDKRETLYCTRKLLRVFF
jgi:metallo-beta-lactamase class B